MDSKYLIQNQQRILNNDEEDVFSIGNEEDNGDLKCMKKLVHLDCENSLSVSSDINDVSEIKHFNKKSEYPDKMITPTNNNAFSYKNNNLRKSEEIIKYISDTSEMSIKNYLHFNHKNRQNEGFAENFYVNYNNQLKLNTFSLIFPGDSSKIDVLNSKLKQYIQSTEYFENKYKDMLFNYSTLNNKHSNLEDFFLTLIKLLKNLKFINTSNSEDDQIIKQNQIINYVSTLISANEKRLNNLKILSINHLNLEFSPSSKLKLKKKLSTILIENISFNLMSKQAENKNKFDKSAFTLEKGFNKSRQKDNLYSPKLTEENEERSKNKFSNDDLRIYSNNFNFIHNKLHSKYQINYQIDFETFGRTSSKKISYNCDTQTKLLSSDIDKVFSLNEEYNNQLISNKLEIQQLQRYYDDQLKNYQNEVNNTKSFELLQPEMIPPEQTIKIFLFCLKHIKYEEEIYKHYVEKKDLKHLKNFVSKIDNYVNKSTDEKRFISDFKEKTKSNHQFDENKNNTIIPKEKDINPTSVFSKYKNMLKNMMHNNKSYERTTSKTKINK